MSTQQATKKPRWRRVVRGLVLAAVALAVVDAAWGFIEARRLRDEIAKIRAAGEPLTFKELNARLPKVDEADDAGPYYEAALALLRHKDTHTLWDACDAYRDALLQSPTSRPADDVVANVDRLLKDNALALDMLDRGARLSGCRFNIGAEQGMSYGLERLGRVRALNKLLALRALGRASGGDGDGAADSLLCQLQMLRMLDQQPLIISLLVKVACQMLVTGDVPTVLELGRPSNAALGRLQEALLKADSPDELERAMLGERVYGLLLMRDFVSGRGSTDLGAEAVTSPPERWPPLGFWSQPVPKHLAVGYLRDVAAFVREARRPLTEVLSAGPSAVEVTSTLGRVLCGPWPALCTQTGRAVAAARCAGVAIMVERYRLAHARLPEALSELAPAYTALPPVDPFTGKDLLYHHDERSYAVYSVGSDQKDDGGDVAFGVGKQPRDVGIRVRLPTAP